MPTAHKSEVVRRSKSVVVIVKPHLSSDTVVLIMNNIANNG